MSAPDSTEQHRHRCEVRQVLRWREERGRAWVHEWINGRAMALGLAGASPTKGVRQSRGDAAADRLLADCTEQYGLGNRGEPGVWLEAPAAQS